jgi:hypothetical protein
MVLKKRKDPDHSYSSYMDPDPGSPEIIDPSGSGSGALFGTFSFFQ